MDEKKEATLYVSGRQQLQPKGLFAHGFVSVRHFPGDLNGWYCRGIPDI